jgi:hypothetical protein
MILNEGCMVGGVSTTYAANKNACRTLIEYLKQTHDWARGVDGSIILNNLCSVVWTGLNWLKGGHVGGLN